MSHDADEVDDAGTSRPAGTGPAGGTAGARVDGWGGGAETAWSPPWWRVGAYAATGLAGVAVAAFEGLAAHIGSLDAPGRLLVAIAAAGMLSLAVRDALARPTLRVGIDGLSVVYGLRRHHLPWAAIRRVGAGKLVHNRRLVHIRVLEISTIDGPVLLSRRQLGTDPERVAAVVEEHRLRHG